MQKIEFTPITFNYHQQCLFDHTTLIIYPNKLNMLVGKSGSGKSTLLKILTKKIAVEEMSCNLNEWNVLSSDEMAYQLIGYQLIDASYMEHLTVKQNIEETKRAYPSSNIESELIETFHFEKLLKKYPHQLSGGQKRILSIILTLMKNLPIIILDEPTSSLDEKSKQTLMAYLKKYVQDGHTVLIATNDSDILGDADVLVQIKDKKIQQEQLHIEPTNPLKLSTHQHPFRFKTTIYHQLWQRFIHLCLVLAMMIFIGSSLYECSDVYQSAKGSIHMLEQTYTNTAYVYYPTSINMDSYSNYARLINQDIKLELEKEEHISKLYPYYAFPLGMIHNAEWTSPVSSMVLSSDQIDDIHLLDEDVFMEFYYPEQLEGNKIYISDAFLNRYQLGIEDVRDIRLDIAVPVDFDLDGEVTQTFMSPDEEVIEVSIPAVKTIYKKDSVSLHIDDVHHVRGEMYNVSSIPLIYAPYSLMEAYIDSTKLPTNGYVLILEDDANIDKLREKVAHLDEDLIFFYPAQTNQQYILENQNWMNHQIKHHIMTCLVCMSVITLFFSLLETLHKKDYLYLRYSGLSKQRYLKYRMIEAGIILSIIAILFSIYALFCIYLPISWIILLMTYILVVPTVLVLYFMFLKFFYGRFDV